MCREASDFRESRNRWALKGEETLRTRVLIVRRLRERRERAVEFPGGERKQKQARNTSGRGINETPNDQDLVSGAELELRLTLFKKYDLFSSLDKSPTVLSPSSWITAILLTASSFFPSTAANTFSASPIYFST